MIRRANADGATLEAIEAVYRRRLPEFLRVAVAIAGDREAARDVVHDAFASAVRSRASFRGDGSLEGWLWRTVVNTALNQRRRRRPEALAECDPAVAVNGDGGPGADAALQTAITLLPERQRLVLFLRFYADLDYRTIADALTISAGTVGATLNAALASLRRTLQEVPR